MTPPPVKILVPKPSSPGTPEEGEVTDDDDDAQYVVVRHADGRTEVVTKEEEESMESGKKSEKAKEYEMVDESKVAQEDDTEEDKGVKFEYIIATKMKPKVKGSKIVKRDEEGNVIDTGDSDNHPEDENEGVARSIPNVTEEKKDQPGNNKDAPDSIDNDKGLEETLTEGESSKSKGEKGDAERSESEIEKENKADDTCETNSPTCAGRSRETVGEEKVEQTEDPFKDDETCISEEPETVIHFDDERPLKAEKLDVTDSEVSENKDMSSLQQSVDRSIRR